MPFYDDHPIRLLMARASLKRIDLARAAGVTYGAVDKLMMGMTKTAHPAIVKVLSQKTGLAPAKIREQVKLWNETPFLEKLPTRARATLALGAHDVALYYSSFRTWREEFAENPTQFASILRIPRATLVEWETGRRKVFPPTMAEALHREFGLGPAYVATLAELPPTDGADGIDPTARIITIN